MKFEEYPDGKGMHVKWNGVHSNVIYVSKDNELLINVERSENSVYFRWNEFGAKNIK